MTITNLRSAATLFGITIITSACGGSSNSPVVPPPPPANVTLEGNVFDGPVSGGTLFVFTADGVNSAIESANGSDDRASALGAANPAVSLTRDASDEDSFSIEVSGELAGQALFLVFDSEGSEDLVYGDQPFNMEATVIAGDAGTTLRVNVTPHTTLTAIQVRAALDPDGDGTVIDTAAIMAARDTALANTLSTYGQSALGEALFPGNEDPHSTTDLDVLEPASSEIGFAVRAAALMGGLPMDDVVYLFAADAADGVLDGAAPSDFGLTADDETSLAMLADAQALGAADMTDIEAISCTASSASLRRACEFEVLDEYFIGVAICAHSLSEADAADCLDEFGADRDDSLDECGEVTIARLDLCAATNDVVHNPPFGAAFANNFVDPLTIGDTTAPNPWFPMVQGTVWTYEGTFMEDGEDITETVIITVTDRIKFIDGIRCLVVRDVVEIDGELIEDTDDWFAQDTDGNIWYCGEEAKDYEVFEGDVPVVPELVAIDGSFKAGRDGDEAGILLPGAPVVGDIFRQELSLANAEDVIEILATDGTEAVPAASCTGNCLVTFDFSPLDPGSEENKYYAAGVGKILEIDLETGNRVELISMQTAP